MKTFIGLLEMVNRPLKVVGPETGRALHCKATRKAVQQSPAIGILLAVNERERLLAQLDANLHIRLLPLLEEFT